MTRVKRSARPEREPTSRPNSSTLQSRTMSACSSASARETAGSRNPTSQPAGLPVGQVADFFRWRRAFLFPPDGQRLTSNAHFWLLKKNG